MKIYLYLVMIMSVIACGQKTEKVSATEEKVSATEELDRVAEDYVRLGLAIGQYDPDFVDAYYGPYYGPDSLKPQAEKQEVFPKDSFLSVSNGLVKKLSSFSGKDNDTSVARRANWIASQLVATQRRIRIFSGEYASFDTEAKELFGIVPPSFTEEHFKSLVKELDHLLPGKGSVNERFQLLARRFIIPADKLDTLYKTAISESRRRTLQHYKLPATEDFRVEYVSDKPWSGYNWYQGNYKSLIQFNTDVSAFIEKAIDVACHEGYPGHHVYNTLLEKNLYRDKGQTEISLYPLFSPQSLIAEGSANYGIDVVFPGKEKIQFAGEVLLPLAGIDTTGLNTYFKALEIKGRLQYVHTEVARRLGDGKMTDKEAVRWTMDYGLFNEGDAVRSLAFKRKYRSYVINYTVGQDLIRSYIKSKGGADDREIRWELFGWLLSNQVVPADLQ
jgi:hypothetical protein